MYKILLTTVVSLLIFVAAKSQIILNEGFETLPLSFTSSGNQNWARTNTFASQGLYADSAYLAAANDSAILNSPAFSTSGKSFVKLEFDHICKTEFFDQAYLEFSVNNGVSWTKIGTNSYLGNGNFSGFGDKFNAGSYIDWDITNPNSIPSNSWWKHETFNLSGQCANFSQVKIRFVLKDGNFNGSGGSYGWLIDNIVVTVSTGELDPPQINLVSPIIADTVFHTGPFYVYAQITDSSNLNSIKLVYSVGSSSDTVNFENKGNNLYRALIPSKPFNSQICYSIIATDNAPNHNIAHFPGIGCKSFLVLYSPEQNTIGYGLNTSYFSPLFTDTTTGNLKYSQHLSIFTAQELNHIKSELTRLAWKKSDTISYPHPNGQLKIWLKHTQLTSVPSYLGAFSDELVGATQVYQNLTQTFPALDNWVELPFNLDSFDYNGNDNLMMLVSWYHPDSASGNFMNWYNTVAVNKATTFFGSGSTPVSQMGYLLRPNTKFTFNPYIYKFDLGIKAIDQPQTVDYGSSTGTISLVIKNAGWQNIQSFKVKYSLDGVYQPIFSWTGNLNGGLSTLPLVIGNPYLSGGSHNLKMWVESPNDSLDQNHFNDTLNYSFYHCDQSLNGIYTLGGTNGNFQTLKQVEEKLSYCGMSGPVEIKIAPGIYQGNITLSAAISGLSAVNTLIFSSATSNPDDVIIQYEANTNSDDFIIQLDNASNVSFKNLTFIARGADFSRALILKNNSNSNSITNCRFKDELGLAINSTAISISSNSSFNKIENCEISNFYNGVMTTQSAMHGVSNYILNNRFTEMRFRGISCSYEDSLLIKNNYIRSKQGVTSFYGMNISDCAFLTRIENNKIEQTATNGYALSLQNVYTKVDVFNNMFAINSAVSTGTLYGIQMSNANGVNLYYNSVSIRGGNSSSSSINISTTALTYGGYKFFNNIFSNFGLGMALQTDNQTITNHHISQSDNNAYFVNGPYIAKPGANYANSASGIASLISITQTDSNSIFSNPKFYTTTNLHSFSSQINGKAKWLNDVIKDIDGQNRNITLPDIGADEFDLASVDAGVIELLNPLETDTQNRVLNMKVVVQNYGSDTLFSIPVKYSLNSSNPVLFTINGVLLPGTKDTFLLGSFTVPALNYSLKIYTQLVSDTLRFNDTLSINLNGLPLVDLQMASLLTPVDACNMGTNETVKIKIYNKGVGTVPSGTLVSYKVMGSSSFNTDTISSVIAAGDSTIHSFATKVNMHVTTSDSLFTFIISAYSAADPRHSNDSLISSVKSLALLPAPVLSDTNIAYGDSVQINALSSFSVQWYNDSSSQNSIASGNSFTTPPMYTSKSYYAEANSNIPARYMNVGNDLTTNTAGSNICIYEGDGSRHQVLILASELQALGIPAGNINGISFYLESTTYNTPHALFEIKIGNTTSTALTTSFITSNLSTVYQSPFTEAGGWNVHTFTSPFYWNGSSNIILDFTIYTDYGNPQLRSTNTSFNSVAYIPSMGAPGVSTLRPNIRLSLAPVLGCNGIRKKVNVNVVKPQYDLAIKKLLSPATSCGIDTSEVKVRLINNGLDPVPGGYALRYKINNGTFSTPETGTSMLLPGDSIDFSFQTKAILPSGLNGTNYSMTIGLNNPNDGYIPNDTLKVLNIFSDYTPEIPTASSPVQGNFSSTTLLNALGSDSLYWYSDISGLQEIGRGNSITVGPLYDTSIFYVKALKTIPLTNFIIGNGTSINTPSVGPSPFGAPSSQGWGLKNQFLITATELRAMGMLKGDISALAFNVATAAGITHNGFTLSMANTQLNELTSFVSNTVQVYYNASYQDITAWNNFNFSTPFYWDGVSNLVVQTCFKNSAWVSAFAQAYYTNTSFISSLNSYQGGAFSCSDTTIKNQYYKRPNIRFASKGYGNCGSEMKAVQVNVSGIPPRDAAIVAITEPTTAMQLSAGNSQLVKVVLKNYGTDTLKNAQISWKVRGVTQNVVNWTGALLRNHVDTVNLGNVTLVGGTTSIQAWVKFPNGIADTITANDSNLITVNVCMGGTYTIGSSVGKHYNTINAAVADLIVNKVCSPVIMNIDSGTYYEQVSIPFIFGQNEINTITFKSSQNDSTKVTMVSGNSVTDNYIFRFKNAAYINLKHLTLKSTGGNYGNVVVFEDTAHHISIENSILTSTIVFTTSSAANCIYSNSKMIHHINCKNLLLQNGANSVSLVGDFYNRIKAFTLQNSRLEYFISNGVTANYMDSIILKNNQIVSSANAVNGYGINLSNTINGFRISSNKIEMYPTNIANGIYMSNASGTATLKGIVDNNFISLMNSTGDNKGIQIAFSSANLDVVFNSVAMINGSLASAAFYCNSGSALNVKNNIFYAKTGYSVYITNPSIFNSFDYNDYTTDSINNTKYVYWTADKNDLAALKAADLTKNVHSVNIYPYFSTNTDLHINEISIKGIAEPYNGITTDIDGDIRNILHPDMGADEFIPLTKDLAIIQMTEPVSSCQINAQMPVKLRLRNMGSDTLFFTQNPVVLKVIQNGAINDSVGHVLNSGLLASGQFLDVVFNSKLNMGAFGLYNLNCSISMSSDQKASNNQLLLQKVKIIAPISVFPFYENFESAQNLNFNEEKGSQTSVSVDNYAAYAGSYGLHIQGGGIASYSYPTVAATAFNQSAHVAKIYSCNVQSAGLMTLNLQFNLKQTYTASGFGNSSLFRVMADDGISTFYVKDINGDSIFKAVTPNQDSFSLKQFNLNQLVGQSFTLNFEGFAYRSYGIGNFSGDNIYIDNIQLYSPSLKDVQVREISGLQDGFAASNSLKNISVVLDNFGTDTLYKVPLAYRVDNGPILRDTFNGILAPASFVNFTLNNQWTILSAKHQYIVFSELSGDSVSLNDTAKMFFTGLDQFSINFEDDFELQDKWFAKGTKAQWERGLPQSNNFTAAHSGNNVWGTILNGNYLNNSVEYLYSPFFTIPLINDTVKIEFWQQMKVMGSSAYGIIQYSTDGISWASLGYIGSGTNWYNTNINGIHAWCQSTSAWVKSSLNIDPSIFNTAQAFQFRFVFKSDVSVNTSDGWIIDDFKLYLPTLAKDIQLISIINPANSVQNQDTVASKIKLKNLGTDTLFSIPLAYKVATSNAVNEIWTGSLSQGDTLEYTFNNKFIAPSNSFGLCAYSSLPIDYNRGNDTICKNITVNPANIDAMVSAILLPVDSVPINTQQSVKARFVNNGLQTINSLPVKYYVNGNLIASETIPGNISAAASVDYTFATTYLSPLGQNHKICVVADLNGDNILYNDSLCALVKLFVGLEENKSEEFGHISLYPNPVKNNLLVDLNLSTSGSCNLKLINLTGQKVYDKQFVVQSGENKLFLDLNGINAGVYFMVFEMDSQQIVRKIIVQ